MTHKQFRKIQAHMDELGLITSINRIGKLSSKRYEVIVNGEVLKKYKTRRSAKGLIVKKYAQKLLTI